MKNCWGNSSQLLWSTTQELGKCKQIFQHNSGKSISNGSHPYCPHVFFLCRSRVAAELPAGPLYNVPQAFGCWNDVERHWNSSALFKIADPQFATCEFPFDIGSFLETKFCNQWNSGGFHGCYQLIKKYLSCRWALVSFALWTFRPQLRSTFSAVVK